MRAEYLLKETILLKYLKIQPDTGNNFIRPSK